MARTYLLRHLVCRVILLIKHSDHRCAPKILGVHVPVAKLLWTEAFNESSYNSGIQSLFVIKETHLLHLQNLWR